METSITGVPTKAGINVDVKEITGTISTSNSTNTPLPIDGVFENGWEEITNYAIGYITVYSDVASATDGLCVQFSTDGVNIDSTDDFTIPAATGKTFSFNLATKYFKVKYTNNAIVEQTEFRLQTIFKSVYGKPSSHKIQDPISSDDDAELQKAVITGLKDDGTFDNASLTNLGHFKVAIQEYGDTSSIDSFDRSRVSEPFTLFDSKQLHDKQPLFWDEELGGSATSVHSSVNAETKMSVTANAADYVIRQTKQRFNYQPGKGQLIFMTYHSPQETGITSRIGIFDGTGVNNLDPNNGIYFETDGILSWNICKDGSITQSVAQADWNVDKLDGTGPSEIVLSTETTQILIIDYEWLGVGRVRVGFVIDGLIRYVHYFNHANNVSFSSVYMSSPNLPLRYSIETDGSNASHLDHICSTVISEGGIEKTGVLRSIDNGSVPTIATVSGSIYAVQAIRLKAAYLDITVIPESIFMISTTNDPFRWSLHINPTVAGTFTYSDITNSALQKAQGVTANTISDEGIKIASGYASVSSRQIGESLNTALRLGSTIAGVQDELVLAVMPIGNNANIYGSLEFRELL